MEWAYKNGVDEIFSKSEFEILFSRLRISDLGRMEILLHLQAKDGIIIAPVPYGMGAFLV